MLLSQFITLETTDSTNNYIAKLAKRGIIPHGTVVLSYEQTEGKGQRGEYWQGESGKNLTMSVYFEHQDKQIKDFQYFTYAISLGIFDLLEAHGLPPKIKWPNDLLIDNKKIGGILIENTISEKNWKYSVVGIGINVNQTFDESNNFSATSMTKLLNEEISPEALAFELLDKLDVRHLHFENNNYDFLKEEYLKRLWKINEETPAIIDGIQYNVIIRGVDDNGLLSVEKEGEITSYDLKEIKFLY